MAIKRAGVIYAALVLAAALQVATVSAASAELSSQTGAFSNSPTGKASASSSLRVTDGSGTAVAFASSEAYATAKTEIVTRIEKVLEVLPPLPNPLIKEQYCPEAAQFIEVEAVAIGEAAASVTVDVVSEVIIEGEGDGCANTQASGEAFAVSFAELFVDAIVTVGIKGFNKATAEAVLAAKSNAFAAAFAEATGDACLAGTGVAIAEQTVTAVAVARPIASILLFLESFVDCSGFSDVFTDFEAGANLEDVITEVSQESNTVAEGVATAETSASAFAVTGRLCNVSPTFDTCCQRLRAKNLPNGGTCFCNNSNRLRGAKCEAKKTILNDGSVFYEDLNSDFACACE